MSILDLLTTNESVGSVANTFTKLDASKRDQAIRYIQNLLHELILTNAELTGNESRACPYCKSEAIIRKGKTAKGKQRFMCKDCKKTFTKYSLTIFNRSRVDYAKWHKFIPMFIDHIPSKSAAKRLGVSRNTAWKMRLRLIHVIEECLPAFFISEGQTVEMDETYYPESFKGNYGKLKTRWPEERVPKVRGELAQGIGADKICVFTAINEMGDIYIKVAGRSNMDKQRLRGVLTNCLLKDAIVKTDGHRAYKSILNEFDIFYHSATSAQKIKGAGLGHINALHEDMHAFIRGFKGIASKNLQTYFNYYTFLKSMLKLSWDETVGYISKIYFDKRYKTTVEMLTHNPEVHDDYWKIETRYFEEKHAI